MTVKLYKNIKARRIALHMTQQELAQKLGYKSTSTIAKIEAGENDIPQARIAAFAAALDTTPADLMGFNAVVTAPVVPDNTVIVATVKGKPQMEELIKRLDGLNEKRLKSVVSVVNTLIDCYEADKNLR